MRTARTRIDTATEVAEHARVCGGADATDEKDAPRLSTLVSLDMVRGRMHCCERGSLHAGHVPHMTRARGARCGMPLPYNVREVGNTNAFSLRSGRRSGAAHPSSSLSEPSAELSMCGGVCGSACGRLCHCCRVIISFVPLTATAPPAMSMSSLPTLLNESNRVGRRSRRGVNE